MPKSAAVYIVTNNSNRVLYTGVTTNLARRVVEHRLAVDPGAFTARYRAKRLVYYEIHGTIIEAIRREKTIKGWLRTKKLALINDFNPEWKDLTPQLWT